MSKGSFNDDGTKSSGHFGSAYSLNDSEATKAHYRDWAGSYDREIGEENGYVQPARTAQALVDHGADSKLPIFDAGCGSGLSGLALAKAGFSHLTGCDFSPEMLHAAGRKSFNAANVYEHLFEADLNERLSGVQSEAFGAVVAVGVFSFGHVAPKACRELLRVLKTGGLFVIALNEHYWDKGDLKAELDRLEDSGQVQTLSREFGDHLPGQNVMGWVIVMRKM